jgi:RNA-directed DNA polymerase
VRDRVVFKAIANIIQPILDKKLKLANPASYAYQKHLGVRQAIERIVNLYANGRPFVFETDIIKFFDSVDKKLLLSNLVFPNLPDDSLNTLIELVLDLEIGNRDQLSDVEWAPFKESEGGIPQGSALSPLLSNVYLAEFDKVMLARRFGLVRYADDFLVLCKTEKEAEQAFQVATDILENNLGLKLHPLDNNNPESKTRIIRLTQTPVEFLSICFNGKRLWPAKEKITELRTKLRDTTDYHKNSDMLSLLTTTKNLIEGWIAAFYFTDIEPYFDEIEFWINWRLAVSLMTMSWVLEKKSLRVEFHKGNKIYLLSDVQRRRSGVPVCSDILSRIRQNSGKIELLPKAQ